MAEEQEHKWQGKTTVEIPNRTADQIWPLLSDYCNIHKWLPVLDTCTLVRGSPGKLGCVRYCAGADIPSGDGSVGKVSWANEKLVAINPLELYFTYEITENNMGFRNYIATMKIFPLVEDGNEKGCKIEWTFVSDPMVGWKLEALLSLLDSCLHIMAKRMEEAFLKTSTR